MTAPGRRASDKSSMRPPWMGRRAIFLTFVASLALLAGLLFWRVGSGEPPHDGAPAWAPDSQRIVFSVERGGQTDLHVMNADGTGRHALTATPAEENAPVFSPDGLRIAFESNRDGNPDIYVMDANGQNIRRLTNSAGADTAPAWSPDGRRLVFLSDRDRAPQSDVYVMNADGTEVRRLTTAGQHWAPQVSPDGRAVAMQTGRDIEVLDLDRGGGPPRRLTADPENGMSPTWSPDGSRLAFASTRNSRLELFLMGADGSNQQRLVSMPGGSALDPRWSPDGTRIAFVYVPKIEEEAGGGQPYAIYVFEFSTQRVTRLSP